MSMSVLIADSSIPFAVSLAESLRGKKASVGLLSPYDSGNPVAESVSFVWNRPSPLSARTVTLEMKNAFSSLDGAVLLFDASSIAYDSSAQDSTSAVRCVDEYVRGFMLLSLEIVRCFREQRKGTLAFAVRSAAALNPALSLSAAVAEGAFIRLADETALSCGRSEDGFQTLLVKLDPSGDAENVEWLSQQLFSTPQPRGQGRWIKAGSRGLFGKF
jgi:hypothetical protein